MGMIEINKFKKSSPAMKYASFHIWGPTLNQEEWQFGSGKFEKVLCS